MLVLTTSVVVGAAISWWAIPPYVLVMAWLLLSPVRPSGIGGALPELDQSTVAADAVAEGAGPVEGPSAQAKSRRPRARARVKTPPTVVPEPLEVSWVQVAPGKFLRVEQVAAMSDHVVPAPDAVSTEGEQEAPAAEVEATEDEQVVAMPEAAPADDDRVVPTCEDVPSEEGPEAPTIEVATDETAPDPSRAEDRPLDVTPAGPVVEGDGSGFEPPLRPDERDELTESEPTAHSDEMGPTEHLDGPPEDGSAVEGGDAAAPTESVEQAGPLIMDGPPVEGGPPAPIVDLPAVAGIAPDARVNVPRGVGPGLSMRSIRMEGLSGALRRAGSHSGQVFGECRTQPRHLQDGRRSDRCATRSRSASARTLFLTGRTRGPPT
jgi:hypothetical protein